MTISIVIRNNVSKLIKLSGCKSQFAFARWIGVPQRTINKIFINDDEIPTTKTLIAIAGKVKAEPWMLLVDEFPWEDIKGKPLHKMSAAGFQLLQEFESSNKETKLSIITQMAFHLQNIEGKTEAADRLMETRETYLLK